MIFWQSLRNWKNFKNLEDDSINYKKGKNVPPEIHLGTKLNHKLIDGINCWVITSVDYVKAAIQTIKDAVEKRNDLLFTTRIRTPMLSSYIPKLDDSKELRPEDLQFFQETIEMLR